MSFAAPTLRQLSRQLAQGTVTSLDVALACLKQIENPRGQGTTAVIDHRPQHVIDLALQADEHRAQGSAQIFAGVPITVKDLFDVKGEVTRAGSVVLAGKPADVDAIAVAKLRAAGFIPIGRTNMTEFAFSGLGINPHYGTPLCPAYDGEDRIAGGSTSGGAVSVAENMAAAALGSDTGGSCRIPAAFCRLVGFKPTARRYLNKGMVPLSPSLDTVGWITRSVGCTRDLFDVLYDRQERSHLSDPGGSVTLLEPENFVFENMSDDIRQTYNQALNKLRQAGVRIVRQFIPLLDQIPAMTAKGTVVAAEAYAWHRALVRSGRDGYDPNVLERLLRGADMTASDYIDLLAFRALFVEWAQASLPRFDALIMPTVPIAPPRLSDLADREAYQRTNALVLRNPSLANLADGCAITLPIARRMDAPAGLTLMQAGHRDDMLLACAERVENILQQAT